MAALKETTLSKLEELFRSFPNRRAALIPALFAVQDEENHLNEENLSALAAVIGMPKSAVYETATFYSLFTFRPRGRHVIRLCLSICCYLRGSDVLQARVEAILGIKPRQTTPDGRFTLELSECLGACDQSPVMMIDDRIFGPLTGDELEKIFGEYR